ncbi:MAG: DegT/DnrJ/EryC1/StrS aminotransferase family protein [Pseudomonadota bacterium]
MLGGPFSPWPAFTEEEAAAVSAVLLSNRVNQWTGGEVKAFEAEFAAFADTPHAIALANGTVALDLALMGLGIGARFGGGAEDEVIVTPRSFVASASSVLNAGARPVFADICPDAQVITPETVAPLIGPQTRGIIAVHLAGWPCDMDGLRALADTHGLHLIEDCAQAHGATYKGRPVGGLGDVAAWSFCQDKIMSTGGEGGMVTCRDPALWERMWAHKDHGKSWAQVTRQDHPPGFRWLHETPGTNWRLTEMQAAIGRIQLKRMGAWTAARRRNAAALMEAATGLPGFRVPEIPAHIGHGFYKFYLFTTEAAEEAGWTRDRMAAEFTASGVPAMQGICPEIYREKAFGPHPRLPVAKRLGETSLMFLVHPTLTPAEIAKTCDEIRRIGALP